MQVEIFLRFSEIAVETKKRDVIQAGSRPMSNHFSFGLEPRPCTLQPSHSSIQARGVSMSSLTWRDVVVKLLSNEAHLPLQSQLPSLGRDIVWKAAQSRSGRVQYVGERIKWFFQIQKAGRLHPRQAQDF